MTVFNINFFKDGTPPGPSKCAPSFVSYMMHTGARVIRVFKSLHLESTIEMIEIEIINIFDRIIQFKY